MADPRTGCVRAVTSTTVPTWRVWLFHDNGMKHSVAPMHQPPSKQSIVLHGLVASILQEGPWDGAGLEAAVWGNAGGLGARGSQVCHLLVAVRPVARAWLLRLGVCLEPRGWWWGGGGGWRPGRPTGDARLPVLSGGSQVPAPATGLSASPRAHRLWAPARAVFTLSSRSLSF